MAETAGPAPLPADGHGSLAFWKSQITAAEEKIKLYAPAWKKNIAQQLGTPLDLRPTTDTVVIPIDHANIEQKRRSCFSRIQTFNSCQRRVMMRPLMRCKSLARS